MWFYMKYIVKNHSDRMFWHVSVYSDCFSTGELLQPPWCIWLDHRTKLYKVTLQLCRIKTIMSVSNMLSHLRIFCHIYNVIYLVVKLLLISIKLLYIYFISHYFLILYHFISHYILLNNNKSNCMTSAFKTIISRRLLTSFTWTENVDMS